MPISDIPILSMLRTKLHWHQERQRLLAENVANADTPEFKPSDLAPPNFDPSPSGPGAVGLLRTRPNHLASSNSAALQFALQPGRNFEVEESSRDQGNAIKSARSGQNRFAAAGDLHQTEAAEKGEPAIDDRGQRGNAHVVHQ